MELRKNWRKLTTALSRFWHREAGPMNWKNPVRVTAYIGWEVFNGVAFLVGEWVRYGVRASQIVLAIPPTAILFFGVRQPRVPVRVESKSLQESVRKFRNGP